MKRYKQIPHTADLAAKIYGDDLRGLFVNAALAMFDMMADLEGMVPEETVNIRVEAPDTESLLISWLNELLYNSYAREMLFSGFNIITLEENRLEAEAKGQKLGKKKERLHTEIKAATYHDVRIMRREAGCEVTVVFDI